MMASRANGKRTHWRGLTFPWLNLVYLVLIFGFPTIVCGACFEHSGHLGFVFWLLAPMVWSVTFVVSAGILSLPHQSSIVAGKFRRNVSDRLYFHRRLYGLCWTAVYYNKPVYFICLTIPPFKWLTFRLFGYRGSMAFTLYPDTWIRDLPLLHFDDGVYVSNRATLGTNIVLSNGYLLVQGITLGANSLVGHLAMLAPGVELKAGAEIAVGSGIGIKTTLGEDAFVGPCCTIEHGVCLEDRCRVGSHSYVGTASRIPARSHVPAGSVIPSRTRFGKQSEHSAPMQESNDRFSEAEAWGKDVQLTVEANAY